MGWFTPSLSQSQVDATVAAALASQPQSFVNSGNEQTVAQLLANYPASASMVFKYARVSDLYGSARSVMICEASGGSFYWRPQRTDFGASNAATSGTITLTPLVSPPVMFLTGSLLGGMTVTPSNTNAWPGATFQVVSKGALNLFGINIDNLIGGGTVPILSGATKTITYIAGAGWQAG